jgi:rod shape determining protein RodA
MVLSRWLAKRPGKMRRLSDLYVPLLIVGLPMVLVAKQPDFGTAIVFLPVGFVMLWVAGIRKRYVTAAVVLVLITVAAVYPYLKSYQKRRITVFLNPGSDPMHGGYNIRQAEIAMGSGRLLGKGWRGGTQTALQFLPEHHTDFIFSSLGEQFGLVGAMVVLLLYAIVTLRSLNIARNAKDWLGGFLVVGLITIFLTHMVLNVGMVLRIFPVTGLPLPFLSYGGSFLLTTYIIFGFILNVGMRKYFFD